MPRADRRYTLGLMERLERTIPNTEGRTWHLEHGSTTYGRWWRVCERGEHGALYSDIAAGATEYDMQRALAHYLDGYAAAASRFTRHEAERNQTMRLALERIATTAGSTTDETATLARVQTIGAIAETALLDT